MAVSGAVFCLGLLLQNVGMKNFCFPLRSSILSILVYLCASFLIAHNCVSPWATPLICAIISYAK